MRSIFTRLFLTASATFLLVSPLFAATDTSTPSPSVDAWVKTVNARIEGVMIEPHGASGDVTASFRRADDGRATDVRIDHAKPGLEHAMRTTLWRLRRLPPMPLGVDPQQRVRVQLLFDDGINAEAFRAKRRTMLAAADVANRRIAERSAVTVLALSAMP